MILKILRKISLKKFLKNRKKGFTLIELVVVVSIISLLSVTVVLNYRAGERVLTLDRSAHQITQGIRVAKAMTMGAVKCPQDTTCAGDTPWGYGAYFDTSKSLNSFILYADINPLPYGDQRYTILDSDIETIVLEPGVLIESSSLNVLSINFKTPDPTITIWDGSTERDEMSITVFLESNPSQRRTIKINRAGLIEVE